MLEINLLPPKEIKKLEIARFNKLMSFFALWLAFFLVVFILFLISIIFSLSIILKSQEELIDIRNNDEKTQLLAEVENNIIGLNQRIDKIYIKQKELIFWTPILEELSEITPSGIYFTNLSYQKSIDKVNLSGLADTREKLLVFQDTLEKSSCFSEIEAPLSNLIKQNNVDFIFTFKPLVCLLPQNND